MMHLDGVLFSLRIEYNIKQYTTLQNILNCITSYYNRKQLIDLDDVKCKQNNSQNQNQANYEVITKIGKNSFPILLQEKIK